MSCRIALLACNDSCFDFKGNIQYSCKHNQHKFNVMIISVQSFSTTAQAMPGANENERSVKIIN